MNGSLLLLFQCTKKDDKGCVENYRPISLTCLIMTVFERCIQKELLLLVQVYWTLDNTVFLVKNPAPLKWFLLLMT